MRGRLAFWLGGIGAGLLASPLGLLMIRVDPRWVATGLIAVLICLTGLVGILLGLINNLARRLHLLEAGVLAQSEMVAQLITILARPATSPTPEDPLSSQGASPDDERAETEGL